MKKFLSAGFLLALALAASGKQPQRRPAPPLEVPARLTASASRAGVLLGWLPAKHAEFYAVYRDGMEIDQAKGLIYVDDSVEPGSTYAYRVTARRSWGGVTESLPSRRLIVRVP